MIHDAIFLLWDCPNNSELLTSDQYYKDKVVHLNPCEREVFKRIVKIAKCHGSIKRFIHKNSFASGRNADSILSDKLVNPLAGMYVQALSEGLDEILEPYHANIVELEKSALANPYLPLSYVLGSIETFKPLFNTLTSILFSIKEKKYYGCQILHVLQRHALSGNEATTTAIQRLIVVVHRVFYEHLCSWLLYGDLKDKKREFFIQSVEKQHVSSPNINSSRMGSAHSTDHSKSGDSLYDINKSLRHLDYEINSVMLPYYIPVSVAQKILFIGKTVVLFDSSPNETNANSVHLLNINQDMRKRFTIWGSKEAQFHQAIIELKNKDAFNISKLDTLLDEIKSCVTEHLWVVAVVEAGVLHELQLMKDFYLLGRGELFLELLRLSEHLLESPPTPVASIDMNQAFCLAARAVSFGNNTDIQKFNFSIPYTKYDVSASDLEYGVLDGWSTLVLNYKVKWPLHLMFTPEIISRYNEIFRFLLRVKKTQHDLHALWFTYKKARRQSPSVWQLHNKLMFLVDNLQHYLQSDVLESNYSKLKIEADKSKDFELLKKAHNSFLTDILSQAFLLMTPISDDSDEKDELDYGSNPVMSNILEVLQLSDAFCSMAKETTNLEEEEYHIIGYTNRFEISVGKLLQLLIALRTQPCGTYLARLLMRLDFNRWFSNTHYLKQSVTSIL